MPDQDCIRPRAQLARYPGTPLGFVIYRLTYKDDDEWNRFMTYFKRTINNNLEECGEADLIPHLAWTVHEDPRMEEATPSEVHR